MLTRVALLAPLLIVFVNGQCTTGRTDHFRCSIWVATGFCNQTFYSDAQKQQYCGTACALCPTTTCGAIYRGTTVTVQNVQAATDATVAIPAGTGPLTRVFLLPTCSMALFTDNPGTVAAVGSPVGPGTGTFITLSGATTTALSMRCTCGGAGK